jgi:uncharacterized SAM-binding protein YcdF (DUF218 family)
VRGVVFFGLLCIASLLINFNLLRRSLRKRQQVRAWALFSILFVYLSCWLVISKHVAMQGQRDSAQAMQLQQVMKLPGR